MAVRLKWRQTKTAAKGTERCTISHIRNPAALGGGGRARAGPAETKPLAGGMTYIPVLKQRLAKPTTIVDLSKLGLTGITVSPSTVTIAAMTTHGAVANSAE